MSGTGSRGGAGGGGSAAGGAEERKSRDDELRNAADYLLRTGDLFQADELGALPAGPERTPMEHLAHVLGSVETFIVYFGGSFDGCRRLSVRLWVALRQLRDAAALESSTEEGPEHLMTAWDVARDVAAKSLIWFFDKRFLVPTEEARDRQSQCAHDSSHVLWRVLDLITNNEGRSSGLLSVWLDSDKQAAVKKVLRLNTEAGASKATSFLGEEGFRKLFLDTWDYTDDDAKQALPPTAARLALAICRPVGTAGAGDASPRTDLDGKPAGVECHPSDSRITLIPGHYLCLLLCRWFERRDCALQLVTQQRIWEGPDNKILGEGSIILHDLIRELSTRSYNGRLVLPRIMLPHNVVNGYSAKRWDPRGRDKDRKWIAFTHVVRIVHAEHATGMIEVDGAHVAFPALESYGADFCGSPLVWFSPVVPTKDAAKFTKRYGHVSFTLPFDRLLSKLRSEWSSTDGSAELRFYMLGARKYKSEVYHTALVTDQRVDELKLACDSRDVAVGAEVRPSSDAVLLRRSPDPAGAGFRWEVFAPDNADESMDFCIPVGPDGLALSAADDGLRIGFQEHGSFCIDTETGRRTPTPCPSTELSKDESCLRFVREIGTTRARAMAEGNRLIPHTEDGEVGAAVTASDEEQCAHCVLKDAVEEMMEKVPW